jgi:Mg2+ and Co2+ transporter CorA
MTDLSNVLNKVEDSLRAVDPPTVESIDKYIPAKHRLSNTTLQSIQSDIRRTITELQEHHQRLVDYAAQLKKATEQMLRDSG